MRWKINFPFSVHRDDLEEFFEKFKEATGFTWYFYEKTEDVSMFPNGRYYGFSLVSNEIYDRSLRKELMGKTFDIDLF
jgi:RNA recognition motif-containing protein